METTDKNIKLVEHNKEQGVWFVRWNILPKLDENNNETGIYEYLEEVYTWIPSIEDIQRTIVDWHNKQTDGMIMHGFEWKGINVLLSDENKFNFSLFTIEAERREKAIKQWDEKHPDMAGVNFIPSEGFDSEGNPLLIQVPTGRPTSRLPITFKLSKGNDANSFYTFETLDELFEFTAASADYLQDSYGVGWYKIATFDWSPYIKALEEL